MVLNAKPVRGFLIRLGFTADALGAVGKAIRLFV